MDIQKLWNRAKKTAEHAGCEDLAEDFAQYVCMKHLAGHPAKYMMSLFADYMRAEFGRTNRKGSKKEIGHKHNERRAWEQIIPEIAGTYEAEKDIVSVLGEKLAGEDRTLFFLRFRYDLTAEELSYLTGRSSNFLYFKFKEIFATLRGLMEPIRKAKK